jgi:hypothetical protein|tara:strand:- start:49 stop:183 length:135 start_codon:yes stop_codon:yes gene_type:complete
MILNNYVSAGYGTMAEAISLVTEKGLPYISKLLRVKMIQQEESE